MKYQKITKIHEKFKLVDFRKRKEEIFDRIIKKIIEDYSMHKQYIGKLFELKNILPLYLTCGFIYLKKYLKNFKRSFKDSILSKVFLTCVWIAIKNFSDTHVSIQDFFDFFKLNYREITFIEAHILSKINYDLVITQLELLKWDLD